MPRLIWLVIGVLVAGLAGGVVWLDHRQAARGGRPLVAAPWNRAASRFLAPAARPVAGPRGPGQIAVLVDELGGRLDVFDHLVALGRPLSVAILPELPLSRRIAQEARRAGFEVLLQLPLEPYRYPELDPGPGALLIRMSAEELGRRARRQVASLPPVAGVTTHMGSRFTEDRARMQVVLEQVRGEGRFFVDGLTTQASVGYDLARDLGLAAARRQVLIDPDDTVAAVRGGLAAVEHWVTRRGAVLAVAHGRLLTVRLLGEALARWEARGFQLVRVSALVEGPAS